MHVIYVTSLVQQTGKYSEHIRLFIIIVIYIFGSFFFIKNIGWDIYNAMIFCKQC